MYAWRKMSPEQRLEALQTRQYMQHPWHSPPHHHDSFSDRYLFTAACLNHNPIIDGTPGRLLTFEDSLIETLANTSTQIYAWVVLPNHYHILAQTKDSLAIIAALGKLHGRTSFHWNGEDNSRGRQVWCGAVETMMKSDRHFWATMNYIHHNPVKHGYVKAWQEWEYTSAHRYLEHLGHAEAARMWKEFPVGEYGKGWDD